VKHAQLNITKETTINATALKQFKFENDNMMGYMCTVSK